jgi:hypothetical protein
MLHPLGTRTLMPMLILMLLLLAVSACSDRQPGAGAGADAGAAAAPAASPWSRASRYPPDEVIAASELWYRIAHATRITARRLTGDYQDLYQGEVVHLDRPLGDRPAIYTDAFWTLADEREIELDQVQADAVRRALDQRRRDAGFQSHLMCGFDPGVAFLFYGPIYTNGAFGENGLTRPSVALLACFKCGEMTVSGDADGMRIYCLSGCAYDPLLAAALAAFPGDAALTALSRGQPPPAPSSR